MFVTQRHPTTAGAPVRPNDPRLYDALAGEWWRPDGEFAALHWIARARAELVPPPPRPGARLLDIACGGGLLAPHVAGYEHVGVDLVGSALGEARSHGLRVAQADAHALPFRDGAFEVVVAGEVLEHVDDWRVVVAEACRVLAPGGTVVVDTIAAHRWARLALVTIGERLAGGPPRGCHDPRLFVDPRQLQRAFAGGGVQLRVRGLAPRAPEYLRFLLTRKGQVRMEPTRSLRGLYQGLGRKVAASPR